jgi:hypothetical protein
MAMYEARQRWGYKSEYANTCDKMEGLSKSFGQHDTPSNMVQ